LTFSVMVSLGFRIRLIRVKVWDKARIISGFYVRLGRSKVCCAPVFGIIITNFTLSNNAFNLFTIYLSILLYDIKPRSIIPSWRWKRA